MSFPRRKDRMIPARLLSFLASTVLVAGLAAQVNVEVRDRRSGGPVAYAHLAYHALSGGPGNMIVSGPDGRAVLPLTASEIGGGVLLRITFMGYSAVQDTLRTTADRSYWLEPASLDLSAVVVTGQYAPIAPERAVHKVRVLDAEYFQRLAANNLADALRNELNIRLQQDNLLGTSLSMQGLGGENVKVLVDGVPVIGRLDGGLDLSQLDLTGIERAEIIEGPLSVSYGTNALAGTINLITAKGGAYPATLKAQVYTEHIGRLNTTLSATHAKGRHRFALNGGRNFFAGWDPSQPGIPSFERAPADTNRVQQWKPREQYFARFNYRWVGERWTLGYKGEGMHDRIVNRGMPRAPYYETAFDEEYVTVRLDNALFAEGAVGRAGRLNALAAYNTYQRTRNTYFRDLTTLGEELAGIDGMQDTTRFDLVNVRAVYSNATQDGRWKYELGTDNNIERGSGERLGADGGFRDIADAALFTTAEYSPTDRLTLRPGVRLAWNSRYDAPVIPSFNMRWRFSENLVARASYARGFRAPGLKELYLYFVDVNHNIVGNPDLYAERSHNLAGSITYRHARDRSVYRSELGLFYNDVEDLITLAQLNGASYTYINVGDFRTVGGTAGASWDNGHWLVSAGGGITGRYDGLASELDAPWVFSPEVRASLTHNWMKHGWTASLFWKYQGELVQYMYVSEVDVVRGFIAPFHMADLTVGRRLWSDRLFLTGGCKDLFNVGNVQASMAGGVHNSGSNSVPMTTGRTWFLRVELDLKRKNA
ncbi:MAG: TonB-dependent receptor [Flavobacteriales bacterium]|nr:TonB-dependent receptor [Flavobacteriales bacterium]